jgi:DNA-binding PadR family transcriptional regulator
MYRFTFGIREEGCHPGGHGRHGGFREGREHGFRGGERGFRGHERGFGGGGRERMFDQGELRLVLLQLLEEKPSYGYELIKTIEEKLAGGYTPSPGVVYPTLTMLEEEGFATVSTPNDGKAAGKKVYTVTDAGREYLKTNQQRTQAIRDRLQHAGQHFERGRSPEIMRAFMSLRGAVRNRVSREGLTAEQVKKIAEAIEAAAKAIDAV